MMNMVTWQWAQEHKDCTLRIEINPSTDRVEVTCEYMFNNMMRSWSPSELEGMNAEQWTAKLDALYEDTKALGPQETED